MLGSACTVLPSSQPPPRLFVLTPKSTFSASLPRVNWQLTVGIPIAEAGLNIARIALRQSPVSLEYYERANWIDTAPIMVQTLLVESFENSNKIVAVARRSVSLRADYSLLSELREFQAEYDGPGPALIRVRLNTKLVKMPQRTIIAALTTEHTARAKGTDIESIVLAFDSALGKSLKRIVEWALTTVPATTR
jgi:cholesterol transport system auxiliary component